MPRMAFDRGSTVCYRDRQRGKVLWEAPHVVVEDNAERVALFIAPGTSGLCPPDRLRKRHAERLLHQEWELAPFTWHTNFTLRLIEHGAAYAIELYWAAPSWDFRCWYVNLQDPLERVPDGFETQDHTLDLMIDPSGSWSWKDEEDLEALIEVGYFTAAHAQAMREDGLRVIDRFTRRESPFCDGWENWRP